MDRGSGFWRVYSLAGLFQHIQTMVDLFLVFDDQIHFFVQVIDNEFALSIDLKVVFRALSVLCLLSVLAHHDKGSLNGSNAGKYQI